MRRHAQQLAGRGHGYTGDVSGTAAAHGAQGGATAELSAGRCDAARVAGSMPVRANGAAWRGGAGALLSLLQQCGAWEKAQGFLADVCASGHPLRAPLRGWEEVTVPPGTFCMGAIAASRRRAGPHRTRPRRPISAAARAAPSARAPHCCCCACWVCAAWERTRKNAGQKEQRKNNGRKNKGRRSSVEPHSPPGSIFWQFAMIMLTCAPKLSAPEPARRNQSRSKAYSVAAAHIAWLLRIQIA